MKSEEQIKIVERGTVQIITPDGLIQKLYEERPLNVKFGVDPTAPDIHLGHTVPLQKLRQLQNLGHNAILVIGDYTAKIGDPSGRSKTRGMLSEEEIQRNMETYTSQVFKVLDPESTRIVYNSEWFNRFLLDDFLALGSRFTVQQLLARDDFRTRLEDGNPLSLPELIYQLLVGYDSVPLEADIEIGGTDQLTNFMTTRRIQELYGQAPEVVITLPLLEGLDGVRKMSKSYGNHIGVTDPPRDMYGKIMSISDPLMLRYYELLSDISGEELEKAREGIKTGNINPMDRKMELAREIVSRYHGPEATASAEIYFDQVHRRGSVPEDMEEVTLTYSDDGITVPSLLQMLGRTRSMSEGRRLIQQGGVRIGGSTISDIDYMIMGKGPVILNVGKRYFRKVDFS